MSGSTTIWARAAAPVARPRLTGAELLPLAVAQALLGIDSEARRLRLIPRRLPGAFPSLPGQSGDHKRLRGALPLLRRVLRTPAADPDLGSDPLWLVDSPPVEGARSRPAARRSDLAGIAGDGSGASHSRYCWGLRPPLICSPAGRPVTGALAHPGLDERQVLRCVRDVDAGPLAERPGLLLLADQGYASAGLDASLHDRGAELLRPASRKPRAPPGPGPAGPDPPAHRVGPRPPQGPTRPRATRRAHPGRGDRPHRPAAARADRHLAQPGHRPAGHKIPDRLRPLISFGLTRLVVLTSDVG